MRCSGVVVLSLPPLTFRTIHPTRDADLCAANHYDACLASFGRGCQYEGRDSYLKWLQKSVEVYPDGFVLVFKKERFIGQLELQVPYGLPTGYVNLFYVSPDVRGRGYGKLLHAYAERYFRSWEARAIELHVSPQNIRAIRFYRRMGYDFTQTTRQPPGRKVDTRLWQMTRPVDVRSSTVSD